MKSAGPDFHLDKWTPFSGGPDLPKGLRGDLEAPQLVSANGRAPAERQRCFIVGCPRSGTTLLQGIIASHGQFASFPETQFFSNIVNDIRVRKYGFKAGGKYIAKLPFHIVKNRFGHSCPQFEKAVRKFLARVGRPDLLPWLSDDFTSIRANVDTALRILDELAVGKQWVEKSPNHLFCVDVITRYVAETRFIHIVRRGEDVIASIYDAALKYPSWAKRYEMHSTVERLVALWIRGLRISLRYRDYPNHFVLAYEDLIADPDTTVKDVCGFLHMDFRAGMLRYTTEGLVTQDEPWKANTRGGAIYNPESKFARLFSKEEQRYIKAHLEPVEARRRSLSASGR